MASSQVQVWRSVSASSVGFSPDGRQVAAGLAVDDVVVCDTATGAQQALLHAPTAAATIDRVLSVAFSPAGGGRLLAFGSQGKVVRVWDSSGSKPDATLSSPAPAPASATATTITRGGAVELAGHTGAVNCVAFSPDGSMLASASADRSVRLWHVEGWAAGPVLRCHTSDVSSVAFSPDGCLLASGSHDRSVRLWSMPEGTPAAVLPHPDWVQCVSFSPIRSANPRSYVLAAGGCDKAVTLWDIRPAHAAAAAADPAARSGKRTTENNGDDRGNQGGPNAGSSSSSKRRRTSASSSHIHHSHSPDQPHTAIVAQQVRVLRGHAGNVWSVAFSPDGRLLASGAFDGTVRLWDEPQGRLLRTLTGHTNSVWSVAFAPNGKQLASGADDTLRIWTVCRWSDRTHRLFAPAFRRLVFHLMCVRARLEAGHHLHLPRLPVELWLLVFEHLQLATS